MKNNHSKASGNQPVLTPAANCADSTVIQAKLSIGAVNDPLESEADQMADRVMRMSDEPFVQRKCAHCEEEDKQLQRRPLADQITPFLQRKSLENSSQANDSLSNRIEQANGGGSPLPETTRKFMEGRFGEDFSAVRIHADQATTQLSRNLNAQAFTVGKDIYFNNGKFSPGTMEGKHLLAHELTHVVQQGAGARSAIQRKPIGAICTSVRIILPNTIVFEGNHGKVTASVKTSLTQSASYSIRYNPGEGQFVIDPGDNVVLLEVSLNQRPQSEIDLYIAYRDSLALSPAGLEVVSGSTLVTSGVDQSNIRFNARELSSQEFFALTGSSLNSIPEGVMVPLRNVIEKILPSNIGPLVAGASHFSPTPWSFIPRNTTGILWGQGHTSIWSNPEGFFSSPTIRGYRAPLPYYLGELSPIGGRSFTVRLHEGVPGSFANDAWFPLWPGEQDYVFVPRTAEQAKAFAERLQATEYGGNYTYSPPRAPGAGDPMLGPVGKTEGSLYNQLTDRGKAPMCTNNCITVPKAEVEAAIGGRPSTPNGVDVMTGTGPEGVVDPHFAGRGKLMTEAMKEGPIPLGAERLNLRVTPGASAGMFVIRGAGRVMLVYGIYKTEERIRESVGTGHSATVITEEAGAWTGGILGSALGGAAAGAIFCAPTGPVDAVCVVGGFLGGLLFGAIGGAAGQAGGHEVGEKVVTPVVDTVIDKAAEIESGLTRSIFNLYGVPYL